MRNPIRLSNAGRQQARRNLLAQVTAGGKSKRRASYQADPLEGRLLFTHAFDHYLGPNGEAELYQDAATGEYHDLADTTSLVRTTQKNASGDYVTTGSKWNTTNITWGYSNLLDGGLPLASGTTLQDIKNAVVQALGLWSAVSGLTFTYMADPGGAVSDANYNGTNYPMIRIGHHYIDGASGLNVLAHCYFPDNNVSGDGIAGDLHLDDGNTWGNGTGGGVNIEETILHELGHGLGLAHANGDVVNNTCPAPKPAIMDACVQGRFGGLSTAYLFLDDIQGVQSIYGSGLGYVIDDSNIAHVFGTGVASNVDGINTMVVNTSTATIFGITLNYYTVSSTYGSTSIYTGGLNGLVVEGMGGNDFLRVDKSWAGIPVTLNGGNGDDFFDFGFNSRVLGGIASGTTVNGGAGTDQIFAYDDSTAAAQTYTVTSARVDRSNGFGGFFYSGDIEHLFLQTGAGADVVNVQSTYTGQPLVLNSAGGADVVNVGTAASGVQGLAAEVQINNSPNFSTVNINNSADTGNRSWLVNDVNTNYGAISGLAPALIVWHDPDITAINLATGSGVDTGNIARLHAALNINNSGSAVDNITIGNASAGGLQSITTSHSGGITIDNNPAYTDLTITDGGDATARTGSLDLVSSYYALVGLSPATIRFDGTDIHNLTLITGTGADTLNISRLHVSPVNAGAVTLNNTGTTDTVNIGNTTDGLGSITVGLLTVLNTPSFTSLNLNDAADTNARTVVIDSNDATDRETISGTNSYNTVFAYRPGDLSLANGAALTTGTGSDTINVLANRRELQLTSAGGSAETVNIGPDLSRVTGDIVTRNPSSFTYVAINDTANTTGRALTLRSQTVGGENFDSVYLGVGTIYMKGADTRAPITINAGSGDDTVTLMSDIKSYLINGNGGNDLLNLGSTVAGSRTTSGILATASLVGGAGDDQLVVNDQDAAASGIVTVNPTTIVSNHAATIFFDDAVLVTANLSNNGETFNVANTGAFNVQVTGGTAKDTISVAQTAAGSNVYLSPSAGFDDVSLDAAGTAPLASLVLSGSVFDLGSLAINNAGRVTQAVTEPAIRVKSLSFGGAGSLDLANGALVVDYTGGSPLAGIRGNLGTGRNGGAWNGAGINSSYAAVDSSFAIGYAEATDIRSAFPATFEAFTDVDSSSVLIRTTLKGDSNLDHAVNFTDLVKVAQNYNLTGKTWSQGDFNYDGKVDFNDLVAIAQNYNQSFARDLALAQSMGSVKQASPAAAGVSRKRDAQVSESVLA